MAYKKDRIFYYDLLRALAIIAVICCHITKYANPLNSGLKAIIITTIHYAGLLGVPIFFMLSGALLLNRNYTLSSFFKKRFSRIIYPFIFWMIIILSVGVLYFHWDFAMVWKTFTGNPSITWYLWVMIGLYLFLPVINSFLKDYGLKGLEYFIVIWVIISILKTFGKYPLLPYLDLSYFAGFIGYFALGYYLDNKEFKLSNKLVCIIGLITFVISVALYVYGIRTGFPLNKTHYDNILNVLMGAGLFLFIKYLSNYDSIKDKIVGKLIVSISICSYGIYYAHALLNKFLAQLSIRSNLFVVVAFIILLFGSWILVLVLSKIPYIKKFCGV